jgi:hypothetical protein
MYRQLRALVLAVPGTALAAGPPDRVVDCMAANLPQSVRVQQVEVTSWDRAGQERTLKGRVFGVRDDGRTRVMARVEHPADLAGTAFLVREAGDGADMYVYLPSVNRVKRLTGSNLQGKLWGTDFSYSEFRRVAGAFDGARMDAGGQARHEGRAVHVLTVTPDPADQEPYDRIRVLVDAESCVPLQAEFHKGKTLRKVLSVPAAALKQADGRWYAGELVLKDQVEGTRTRLRVLGVTTDSRLSKGYFHPQQFHTAR